MIERRSLGRLAREPLYNTNAVVQSTGVPAATIRAWERRYGLPSPFRTPTNQRLYSASDTGIIGWLRDRTGEGMTISQAIQRLKLEYPELFDRVSVPEPSPKEPVPLLDPQPARLRQRFLDAVAAFETEVAERVLDESFARFSIEEACTRVIEPALIEIGERWSRSDLSAAVEHLATRIIASRLAAMFALVRPVTARGTIVAACPPGEEHEIGLLVLAIFLARRGWRVVMLGANLPAAELVAAVRSTRPDVVCLSASTQCAAVQAIEVAGMVRSRVIPTPLVALGGRGFVVSDELEIEMGGVCRLTGGASDVADTLADMIGLP